MLEGNKDYEKIKPRKTDRSSRQGWEEARARRKWDQRNTKTCLQTKGQRDLSVRQSEINGTAN